MQINQDYTTHTWRNEFIEIFFKIHSYCAADGLGIDANNSL